MGTIYNLEYDFSTQNGQSIVFSKKNGAKLVPADLNAVQLKMIQSNQIPHMLPLSLENIDLEAKLHYDINSKQKLITYFRDNKTTMNDYYQLFLSIINTLEEAGSYMLDQNKYILTLEFLYIGQHAGDVYLTYLPVNDIEKNTTIAEDMKKLLTDVAGETEGLQGNEFKSILNYIKNSGFSISGLKKLLLELISLRSNVYQQQFAYEQSNQQYGNEQEQQLKNPNQREQQDSIVAGSENVTNVKRKKKLPPLTSKEKTYTFLAAILLIAFSWKLYDMYTNNAMLIVTIVLSILALAGAVTYLKFWRPGVEAIEVEVEVEGKKPAKVKEQVRDIPVMNNQTQLDMRPSEFQKNVAPNILKQQVQAEPQIQPTFQPVYATDSGSSALDTTLLNVDHDDTVLLENEQETAAALDGTAKIEVKPVLTRVSQDEESIAIKIDAKNFLIGRNEESVNFVETAAGVSRIHAEIISIDGTSYGIKDLGSKNGSKLNGNPMVPYKLHALNEDDEIELGKAHYTFNWSNEE